MNTTITQNASKVNELSFRIDAATDMAGLVDDVYPFEGSAEDKWTVVIGEAQIAWAAEYGTACMIYVTALQTRREHAERCPADSVPFDGFAPEVDDDGSDDYGLSEATI